MSVCVCKCVNSVQSAVLTVEIDGNTGRSRHSDIVVRGLANKTGRGVAACQSGDLQYVLDDAFLLAEGVRVVNHAKIFPPRYGRSWFP